VAEEAVPYSSALPLRACCVVRKLEKQKVKKTNKALRVTAYKNAEKYEQEYKDAEAALVNQRRTARQYPSLFYVEPEAKVLLVIRIRGIMGVSPKVKKILQLLRLRQLHNAVFVRVNKPMMNMLKLVEPFVTYGAPSLKTVRSLLYKRGYAKIDGQRIRIDDNHVISESKVGGLGMSCVEDIVHEIFTSGPKFKPVNKWLWPFKLSSPTGGFVRKSTGFAEGGDAGNRERFINRLVKQMN